jgi:hypothetical protein
MRAEPPCANARTCSAVAIVVSPGKVVSNAPCAQPSLPVKVARLQLRRRFVRAVVEDDGRADALAAVAVDGGDVWAAHAVVLEPLEEGADAHRSHALRDEVADGVVDHRGDDASVHAETVGEIRGAVELAAADVDVTTDVYEPVHGSAPDIAGTGLANPLGAIASAALLLRHTARLEREAQDVEASIRLVLEGGYRTADIQGRAGRYIVGTEEMGTLVAQTVAELADMCHAYQAV